MSPFTKVFDEADTRAVIGGPAKSTTDGENEIGFAFDYDSSGKLDHLVFYRPGTGDIWISRSNPDGTFIPVFNSNSGTGGYDLLWKTDRLFAFDYESTGKLDHLVAYRPGGGGAFFVLHNNRDGTFTPHIHKGAPSDGIGGFNLNNALDYMFAFDYNSSGRQDHLAVFRPGAGVFWILRNNMDGTFSPVFQSGDPNVEGYSGQGIGGYDLNSPNDKAFAFDYDGSGKMDHIVLYRPGRGAIFILKNDQQGGFKAVYAMGDWGNGIGNYNLHDPRDLAFAYDWSHTGKKDHIAIYRPGTGTFWVVERNGEEWKPVFNEGDPGNGLPGFDLKNETDRLFAFDFRGIVGMDCLLAYRGDQEGYQVLEHP